MRHTDGALWLFCISLVMGCGGSGTGGDTKPLPIGGITGALFVADAGNSIIASKNDANPPAGPPLNFDRSITNVTGVKSLVYDSTNNRLYVAKSTSILVFDNASTAAGNVGPSRTITSDRFDDITSVFVDTANNILYVGDNTKGVWMFDSASGASGRLTPDRELTGDFGGTSFQIRDIFVDTDGDILYVSRSTSAPTTTNQIYVFDTSALNSGANSVPPDRIITPSSGAIASITVGRIFVDVSHDRLYMVNRGSSIVLVFDPLSTTNGTVDRAINLGVPATDMDIVVDVRGNRLYAVDRTRELYIVDNAHTTNSVVAPAPKKTLSAPNGSQLSAIDIKQ